MQVSNSNSVLFNRLYLAFFVLMPVVYTPAAVDPVLVARHIFLALFILTVGFFILATHKEKLNLSVFRSPVIIAFIVFVLVSALSIVKTIVISEAINVVLRYAIEFLFFFQTSYLLIQRKLSISTLIKGVILFAVTVELVAIYDFIKASQEAEGLFTKLHRITAVNGNKNLASACLFLCLPFLAASSSLSKNWRLVSLILAVVGMAFVLLLQARAAMFAYSLFMTITFLYWLKRRNPESSKLHWKYYLTGVVILLLAFGSFAYLNPTKFARLLNSESIAERVAMWQNTLEMISDNPVLGVGAGNWQIHYPKYGLDHFPTENARIGITSFQRPHNDFLWVFSESGMIGFLAYCFIFSWIIYSAILVVRKAESIEEKRICVFVLAALIGYFPIALFDFPLERIEHQVLLLTLFSMVVFKSSSATTKPLFVSPNPFSVFVACLSGISIFVSTNRWIGEYHSHKLLLSQKHHKWGTVIREADLAINTFYELDPLSFPLVWFKGLGFYNTGKISEAQTACEAAYELSPYNVNILNNLAAVYEEKGQHLQAIEFYQKTLSISPQMEEPQLNLAAVYFNMKSYKKAYLTIDKCNPSSSDPRHPKFLSVILEAWFHEVFKLSNKSTYLKFSAIRPEDLTRYYFIAKQKKITFGQYLSQETTSKTPKK